MSTVEWGQAVRPSVKELISAVNELESYTDIEHEVTGTFLTRESANGLGGLSGVAEVKEILGNTEVVNDELISSNITGLKSQGKNIAPTDDPNNPDANYVSSGGGSTPVTYDSAKSMYTTVNHRQLIIANVSAGKWTLSIDLEKKASTPNNLLLVYIGTALKGAVQQANIGDTKIRYTLTLTFTETNNLRFIFYGAAYWNNLQVEPGSTATPYEPYKIVDTLEFPAQTLRGIGTAQDVMTRMGIKRHIGEVDLGSLTWTKGMTRWVTGDLSNTIKIPASNQAPVIKTTAQMVPVSSNADPGTAGTYDVIVPSSGNFGWYYPLDAYADAAAFKTAMSGVMLQYELATTTTETFATPIDLTYRVEAGGSESWITPTGTSPTSSAPTATISYKMQYEYELITEKSFDNFCTELGTALNLDIEKEWNDVTKEWEFTITQARSNLNAIDITEREELYSIGDEPDILEPIKEVDENEQR